MIREAGRIIIKINMAAKEAEIKKAGRTFRRGRDFNFLR